jgi:hypothetical protein
MVSVSRHLTLARGFYDQFVISVQTFLPEYVCYPGSHDTAEKLLKVVINTNDTNLSYLNKEVLNSINMQSNEFLRRLKETGAKLKGMFAN